MNFNARFQARVRRYLRGEHGVLRVFAGTALDLLADKLVDGFVGIFTRPRVLSLWLRTDPPHVRTIRDFARAVQAGRDVAWALRHVHGPDHDPVREAWSEYMPVATRREVLQGLGMSDYAPTGEVEMTMEDVRRAVRRG